MAKTDSAPQDKAEGESLEIPALDGRPLAASLFAPAAPAQAAGQSIVVVAPGAAIPRRFYRHFARAVAERGATAVTFDVRDIGGSRRGSIVGAETRMRDWALKDVAGVIAWARQTFPQQPLYWVGHSMGGFATGLAGNGHEITRQLSVATLNGYWGRMAGFEGYRVLTMMGGFAPLVIATRGYMPGALMGGEDMPGPAFLEWRQWCLDPDFLFADATLPEKAHFERFRAPNRFIQIADDAWGTPASVGDMAQRFSASADVHVVQVTPVMANVSRIGHFGFFKPEMKATLWGPALDWLLEHSPS
ncbi:MAG: alpha/beta fold hydrolase [Hyphomicrobiales bacterium]|nr:MAG: alpha/beta fold hydrolase [Hyphomicrobiales bacterium]